MIDYDWRGHGVHDHEYPFIIGDAIEWPSGGAIGNDV